MCFKILQHCTAVHVDVVRVTNIKSISDIQQETNLRVPTAEVRHNGAHADISHYIFNVGLLSFFFD